MPRLVDDSPVLGPERRSREIAAILARGMLRLQCMRQVDPVLVIDAAEPAESRLEAAAPSHPDVTGS